MMHANLQTGELAPFHCHSVKAKRDYLSNHDP